MLSQAKIKRNQRIMITLNTFLEKNGEISDEELAILLNNYGIKTSHSTVDRDLSINLIKMFKEHNLNKISSGELDKCFVNDKGLTDKEMDIYAFIIKKRRDNKKYGQIRGGQKGGSYVK